MSIRSVLLVCVLSASLLGAAPTYAVDNAAFGAAFTHLQKARSTGGEEVEAAITAFTQLNQQEPGNPVLMAYLGSAQTLQGRDAWFPWNKMKYTENGLASIDKALQSLTPAQAQQRVRGVPVSLETRLVAASTFLSLPALFKRDQLGREQLQRVLSDPDFLSSPPAFRQVVVGLAVKTATADNLPKEQISQLQALNAEAPATRQAAQDKLKELWK